MRIVDSWSPEQIDDIDKWMFLRAKLRFDFFTLKAIEHHLNRVRVPCFCYRTLTRTHKILFYLAIGTPERHVDVLLQKLPIVKFKQFGVWNHRLVLGFMMYVGLIKHTDLPIDPGVNATLSFCMRVWRKFLRSRKPSNGPNGNTIEHGQNPVYDGSE